MLHEVIEDSFMIKIKHIVDNMEIDCINDSQCYSYDYKLFSYLTTNESKIKDTI